MSDTVAPDFVLPGDLIDAAKLRILSNPKQPVRLSVGLRHVPPSDVVPVTAGRVTMDRRKNVAYLQQPSGRYIPSAGDVVIGTIQRSTADLYQVSLSDFTANATLPTLSFEKATKKTKPNLSQGALVCARVSLADKHMDAELECVSTTTGRADGLGPLVGGMVFTISTALARRMLLPRAVQDGKVVILEELGTAGLSFESAIGHNGRLWVSSESQPTVLVVGRAVMETDEKKLTASEQKKLAKKLVQHQKQSKP